MFRLLKSTKQLPLGRWKTDKSITVKMRLADLANYDSCGTCGIPNYDAPPEKYLSVGDDVVDLGYNPLPGSFDLYKQKKNK
tara:strand:- start:983 stop:1225 length:243 start_codon:yes stop_codon:yes gene_type:complete